MKQTRMLIGINVFWFALSFLSHGLNTLLLPFILIDRAPQEIRASLLGLALLISLGVAAWLRPALDDLGLRLRRYGGRRAMMAAGVALTILALFLTGASASVGMLLPGFLLVQLASGVARAAQRGLSADLVPLKQHSSILSLKILMNLGGTVFGYLIVGQLLRSGESFPPLGAMATFLAIGVILVIALVREPRNAIPDASIFVYPPEVEERSLRTIQRMRAVGRLDGMRFLFFTAMFGMGAFFLLFLHNRLGLDPVDAGQEAGFLLTALAAVTVVFVMASGAWIESIGRYPLMLASILTSTAGVLLMLRAHDSLGIFLTGCLVAAGLGSFLAAQAHIEEDFCLQTERGRIRPSFWLTTAGAGAAAGLFGPLVDLVNWITPGAGFSALFLSAAGLILISGAALLSARRLSQQSESAEAVTG